MPPLVLKLALTPGLIAVATLAGRRWGPGVSGLIAGLPLTSGPILVFLTLEQGAAFAARAATGNLLGLLSQAGFCLAYGWTARRARWLASGLAGVAAFFAVTLAVDDVSLALPSAIALVCALLTLAAVGLPRAAAEVEPLVPPRWDLPLRMVVATAIVILLTTLAARLGPSLTGLLSPFPVFALVLAAFAHRSHGAGGAARLLRGVVLGSFGHATFSSIVGSLLPRHDVLSTYVWASCGAVAVNALVVTVTRRAL